ncbi:MAG: valine--tRNA ligase, partial [Candidatus Methanofastidiosia archaeon]
SQAEFIARYKRMKGFNVFYPMGFDDNGLATERWVEQKYGLNIHEVGREEFIKKCLEETKIGGEEYRNVWTRLGISVDWNLLYSTINEHCRKISQRSFVDLYRKKRIVRREEPVLWCPHCRTAIAQSELEDMERETTLNFILFEGEDGNPLEIATTRPELLPACVAVVVHPDDERYSHLIGKKAIVPTFNQEVEIIQDRRVDREFGTGIVMICTFGDLTDIEWWREYKLPLRIVITMDGRLNHLAREFEGLPLSEARKKILHELKKGNLVKSEEPLRQSVNTHERCHTPIEYYITKQFFVKVLDIKDKLIEIGRKMKWYPDYMRCRYELWIENLKWDWCISRQRYFGVPFPVWYCKRCGEIYVANFDELPVDPTTKNPKNPCPCGSCEFIPEKDVLDTWFTSSVTPLINARWMEEDSLMDKIYPMRLRPQGYDIIRTWAYYTILKSLLHSESVPWYNVMISGMGLDPNGEAMHSSRGNVVLPLDVADKYSADAVRWWSSGVTLGNDLPFKEKDVVAGHKLCIKLWNAAKFCKTHLKDYKEEKAELREIDKWILERVDETIEKATKYLDVYEYSKAKILIEQSFWHDFCDNYLEIVKYRLYFKRDKAASFTLYHALLSYVKMFAIYIPYVTEDIYQNLFRESEKEISIHTSSWPEKMGIRTHIGEKAVRVISELRKWKSENGIALNAQLSKVIIHTKEDLSEVLKDIKGAMNIKELEITKRKPQVEERIT